MIFEKEYYTGISDNGVKESISFRVEGDKFFVKENEDEGWNEVNIEEFLDKHEEACIRAYEEYMMDDGIDDTDEDIFEGDVEDIEEDVDEDIDDFFDVD